MISVVLVDNEKKEVSVESYTEKKFKELFVAGEFDSRFNSAFKHEKEALVQGKATAKRKQYGWCP